MKSYDEILVDIALILKNKLKRDEKKNNSLQDDYKWYIEERRDVTLLMRDISKTEIEAKKYEERLKSYDLILQEIAFLERNRN